MFYKKINLFIVFLISFALIVLVAVLIFSKKNSSDTLHSQPPNQSITEEQSNDNKPPTDSLTNNTQIEEQASEPDANIDPILTLISSMTLEEKIGQLFILGFDGKHSSELNDLHSWISDYHIGNYIVFKRNIKSNTQLKELIEHIDEQNSESAIPIWIGIDQEGGKVNRLIEKYPAAEQYGKWNDPLITYSKHNEMAQELTGLGIDINFGPVLDINSNPKNPVINSRAFGSDANTVMKHTEAVIDAYYDNKLLAVGKHFPGHGDTIEDSHKKLPVITKSWEQLLELELLPFQHAIKEQIPSIMVGHLLLSSIDEQYPASLSSIIIQDKLIDELGFNGLIITDDLIMEGILDHFTIGQAAVRALEAGVHLLIIGHNPTLQLEAIEAVQAAYKSGLLNEAHLNDKLYSILSYKLNSN